VFLHAGEFYRSLSVDDPECTICIPSDCFVQSDQNATDITKVCDLLRVAIFWMLDAIPLGVLVFCSVNDVQVWQTAVAALPGATESRILSDLLAAYSHDLKQSFVAVIRTGRFELIEHAISRLAKDSRATAAAAEAGDVRVLRLLFENAFMWHQDTCTKASEFGHLECLQFAHENGCPWTEEGSHVRIWCAPMRPKVVTCGAFSTHTSKEHRGVPAPQQVLLRWKRWTACGTH